MKTKLTFLSLAIFFVISACKDGDKDMADNSMNTDSKSMCAEMMNDPEMTNMTMDCMMNMSAKDTSMCRMMCDKMMGNKQMMAMMMDNMMEECKKDTAMCNMMCGKMMNTPHMKGMMKDMMNEDGTMHHDMKK